MKRTDAVWIIDDDPSIRWVLAKALSKADIPARCFADGNEVLERLSAETPGAVVTDVRMPALSGFEILDAVREVDDTMPVIVMTAYSDIDSAVASFQGGAFDYLSKPFDVDHAVALIRRALSQKASEPHCDDDIGLHELVGEAPSMQAVFRAIGRLSGTSMHVLIRGESGTGKELVARALHRTSPRSDHPFIAINTAAIPAELLESELFGHERGAFTGATARRVGRFEQAHGGTLFLDEIGDMPAGLQTRLLRVLSEGSFYRVGGHDYVQVDVRIVAATHQDLDALIADGRFREDLYHRLNVVQLALPPLRERREDIPALAARFLRQAAVEIGAEPKALSPSALESLGRAPWPGNVRELENLCRRLTVMAPGRVIELADLPALPGASATYNIGSGWTRELREVVRMRLGRGETDLFNALRQDFERCLIEEALSDSGGHRQEAARRLGIGRNTLARKYREADCGPAGTRSGS